jgi:exo-beta-1,3-glucanase (GH17 family)
MSFRRNKLMSLSGIDPSNVSKQQLSELFHSYLDSGMHGISFSAYEEGQEPGDDISREQVERRMLILKPSIKWVRSFSCCQGNDLIPIIAKEMGLKTLVGAWLGDDLEKNELEIASLIRIAKQGLVDIAAVGNEVMYRKDLSEEQLLDYIARVKKALPDIPVGYVDAYYEFEDHPAITKICDVILANCYPFWEGCAIEYSLLYMKDMYRRTIAVAEGKEVIITETGWPNRGKKFHGAEPSEENAVRYFLNTQHWAKIDNINIFYFSSFDESWKVGAEGDVGAFWGLWDKNEQLKYCQLS